MLDFNKPLEQLIDETLTMPAEIMDPVEAAAWQMREFMPAIERIMLKTKRSNAYKDNFFIVAIPRWNVVKKQWTYQIFTTNDCPTPTNNQTVFHYIKADARLDYLWTIPDRERTQEIYDHVLEMDPQLDQIKQFVVDYMTGELDKLTRRLNKEDIRESHVILTEHKE